ncbi:MAG TPA: DUF6262 family protein [Slackia equolifaciens]|uniref:DUF6262 family protein n=1 Tax=Slackia equolifaciens TaxID=498718 RepID=A0A9D2UWZ0_9ACTN|nr:DUF6262 family protein [Slackia equolifaciens]
MSENGIHALDAERRRASEEIADRVRLAVAALLAEGRMPSFYAVADVAGVARSTLYRRDDLKEIIVRAREGASLLAGSCESPQAVYISQLLEESERLRSELGEVRDELSRLKDERIAILNSVSHYWENESGRVIAKSGASEYTYLFIAGERAA